MSFGLPYKLPTASEKRKTLRKIVESRQTIILPGIYNTASAMLAEKLGFKAVYVGSAITTLSMGLPDLGIITLKQMASHVSTIENKLSIPTIVDVDTGYDNVAKTTRMLEKIGAAGFHIEDQIELKKCGHLSNKRVIPAEKMVKKIKAAVSARKDINFIIIARTDARGVINLDDAVYRANLYREAGADVIFPEALLSKKEFEYVAKNVKAPLLANMTEYGRTPYMTAEEFRKMGYTLVLFPVTTLRASLKTVEDVLLELKNKGTQKSLVDENKMKTRQELQDLIKYEKWEHMINEALARKKVK